MAWVRVLEMESDAFSNVQVVEGRSRERWEEASAQAVEWDKALAGAVAAEVVDGSDREKTNWR